MSQELRLPPLYAILDPEQTKARAAETVLRELLEGGIELLQLRAKVMPSGDFLRLALTARARTRSYDCKLIVNDRVDIALACGADGVHLGQQDLPLLAARKLMGDRIIGISTHDLEQAREAERSGADYIGFGPLFGTATKDTGYSARGVVMLRAIRKAVSLPIVAIGGITETNVTEVWQAGANSAAIISDILAAADIAAKAKRIAASRPVT
ncbi:MAG: thiamine phosphate synthase [Candidatus Binatia bacterium]|jgi:thiamine-phosphate diphosphorylase